MSAATETTPVAAGEHDWQKTNLVTNDDMTDSYRCRKCRATGTRHGLGWPPVTKEAKCRDKGMV